MVQLIGQVHLQMYPIPINNWDQSRFGAQKIYPKNPVTLDGIRDAQ